MASFSTHRVRQHGIRMVYLCDYGYNAEGDIIGSSIFGAECTRIFAANTAFYQGQCVEFAGG